MFDYQADGQYKTRSGKEFDAFLVKVGSEEVHASLPLQEVEDNKYQVTTEFVMALCNRLRSEGLNFTPTEACEAWQTAANHYDYVEKKSDELPTSATNTDSGSED